MLFYLFWGCFCSLPDGHGHPCHDKVLQPTGHVLWHLRLQQVPLRLQVPLVPPQHLFRPQEKSRLCFESRRSVKFEPFLCFTIRKETISFPLLNGWIGREWCLKEDSGMIHDFCGLKKHLNWDVNAVLLCLSLCFVPSVWNSGRHIVQHSVDAGLQTLHEQPESSLLLPRGGKRWTLKNYFQSLSYL